MREYRSSVSPKGQITLPLEVRRRWGIKPKDHVTFRVDEQENIVVLVPARSPVDESYGAVPPLPFPISDHDITEIAAEEHALEIAREGLEAE